MHRPVGKAFAFIAASRAAVLAVLSKAAGFATRARQSLTHRWAELRPELELRARWLRGRARRLPQPVVRLMAAGVAVVLTLAALALPSADNDRMLASVELALVGSGGTSVADAGVDELLIEPPAPLMAADLSAAQTPDVAVVVPQTGSPQALSAAPAEEPDLAGLADIPEELIVNPPKAKKEDASRRTSFAAPSETRESLPWKAVEPVVFTPMGPGQQQKPGDATTQAAASAPADVSSAEIGKWMKGKATKIMGAERTKPLYHFVVWVEPPEAMKARVAGVSYDFSSPAVQPQSQASMDRDAGFKINAAGLACADHITVTLRFDDGRVEKTNIDGCELFNKA